MKEFLPKEQFKYRTQLIFRYVMLSILFLYALFRFEAVKNLALKAITVTAPILVGFIMAFIVDVPMSFVEEKLDKVKHKNIRRFKRVIAMLISYIVSFFLLALLISLILPQLIDAVMSLQYKIPAFLVSLIREIQNIELLQPYITQIEDFLYNYNWSNVYEYLSGMVTGGKLSQLAQNTVSAINSIATTTVNMILSFIFSIYVVYSKDRLKYQSKKLLYAICSEDRADILMHVFSVTYRCFRSFIVGRLIDAVIIGVLSWILFLLFRLPYAGMVAVLVGVTNVIPIVGPFIGGIIGAILIFIANPQKALIFIVLIFIIQQTDGNIIFPKIAGKSMSLPSTWTLGSVTIGASLLGIVGILIFVPTASIIYTLLGEYSNAKIQEKGIRLEEK